mgnify:CR=1 FL=1
MKGLERITQRIQTDAQGQIEALTAAGRRQAQEITEKYEDQARQLSRISGEPRAAPTAPAGSSSSPASSSSLTIPSDRPGSS